MTCTTFNLTSRMKHELLTREYDFSPRCQPADGAAYLCYIPDCFLGNIRRGNHLLLLLSITNMNVRDTLIFKISFGKTF